MKKEEKNVIIQEIKELAKVSDAIYVIDYAGVNVEDITNLRRQFRNSNVKYKVYKNTLIQKALDELGGYGDLKKVLKGMNGFAFVKDNVSIPAKIIEKYYNEKQKFSLKGCYLSGQFYDGSKLKELANLPTKEDLIASIIGSIYAPASGIVGAINAVMRDIVSIIDQISKKEK